MGIDQIQWYLTLPPPIDLGTGFLSWRIILAVYS
jgi:hypothetical protein